MHMWVSRIYAKNQEHRGQGSLLPGRGGIADGLPRAIATPWAMPPNPARGLARLRRHRRSLPHHVYLVTASSLERTPWFTGAAAISAARCFDTPALWGDAQAIAWVLMPDHAHWLIRLGDHDSLSCVVNRIKSASARTVNGALHRFGTIWAPGYHERCLRNESQIQIAASYVRDNPVRAGLAVNADDYPFLHVPTAPL